MTNSAIQLIRRLLLTSGAPIQKKKYIYGVFTSDDNLSVRRWIITLPLTRLIFRALEIRHKRNGGGIKPREWLVEEKHWGI